MTDFEVRGTLNIVEACANSSVKRLVLTSSLSTMVWDQQRHPEKVIDEKCWSNLDFCRSKKLWGPLAKTMTEKAAWSLARDKELDMVVINPAIVLGPKVFGTTQCICTYLKGFLLNLKTLCLPHTKHVVVIIFMTSLETFSVARLVVHVTDTVLLKSLSLLDGLVGLGQRSTAYSSQVTSVDRILFVPAGVKELPQSGLFAYAHVEDVAEAHVSALESTEASGRYICYERVISEEKLVELIRKLYPDSSIPSRYEIIFTRCKLMVCKLH
ncbi:hypothetical protein KC19_9G079100 [Ceratodon purpureus]|uniref:NAD-dependent epimerase/dehydratase domain-containing protein n=1 Tax=Ceratodon purpureus TaxID=3225 RepID=A0A8T0GRS4_CERPU|nr:hypothetical protein KC19_9G079100 [Ceratodon purpureus]